MEPYLSHWLDGVCFKCTHYTHRHCQKHGIDITGDATHRCDDYELNGGKWYNEQMQQWEYRVQSVRIEPKKAQTTMDRWF